MTIVLSMQAGTSRERRVRWTPLLWRHALDKALGHALRSGLMPLENHILMVSGRVSFELMQKALAGGIPVVAAFSAPSSLAVDFAKASGQTLVGFLRGETMNVYANSGRVTA